MKSVGPVLVAIVVIAMIIGLGYWASSGTTRPAGSSAPATKPQAQTGGQAPATTPAPGGSQTAAGTGTTTTPPPAKSTTPADPRAHIDRSGGAKDTMKITVYYADGLKNGEVMQPVEILVPKTAAVAQAVAENVVNAPTDLKLYSNFPPGTKVNKVDLKDGLVTVDLSAEAATVTGSASVQNLEASLVYSLTAVPGVQKVLVKVNGKTAMLDQTEWSEPLAKADMDARNWFTVAPPIKFVP